VDESEKLHRPEWARSLESSLRALISDTPGVRGHLGLIMTGGVDFYHDMIAPTDGSPLRDILEEEIILTPASREEMLALVDKPTDGALPEDVAAEIVRQAGGHLFLGQFILRHLWDQGLENADVELVGEIAESFAYKRRDYESWLDALGPESQQVYSFLVGCGEECERREISRELGITPLDARKTLDILTFHCLVDQVDRKFTCRTEMIRAWYADNILGESRPEKEKPVEIFISYAHEDEELCNLLKKHFATLERQNLIELWHDRCIRPGQEWAGQIDRHINSAQMILFLISADFMASDYCYDIEVARAMERHEDGDAIVIPVALRACDLDGTPFEKLQGLPKDMVPITEWNSQDRAFYDVVQGIRAAIKELKEN
jgi:hypothetical protein